MKCIGVYRDHRLYYDLKHKEYLLMTPNFRFTRSFGHCHDQDVAEWANNKRIKNEEGLRNRTIRFSEC